MIVHHVRFWLKKDADLAKLRRGLKSLLSIPMVSAGWYGAPAKTEKRPVIDASYDQALVLHFQTIKDHDAYQAHLLHDRFIAACAPLWSKVQVVDTAV